MARNDNVQLTRKVWGQLTNGNTVAIRVDNETPYAIRLMGTVGEVAPTTLSGSISLPAGEILAADITLEQLFPGVAGVNRVYAFSTIDCEVSVSHA